MKKYKIVATALALVILVSAAIPAAATPVVWQNRFATFATISLSTAGTKPGYTIPLQTFLTCYDSAYSQKIMAAGGIDGYFGSATKACVVDYQTRNSLSADGCVGTNTWKSIASHLWDEDPSNGYIYFLSGKGGTYIIRATNTSPYIFYYYITVGGNPTTVEFHTTY